MQTKTKNAEKHIFSPQDLMRFRGVDAYYRRMNAMYEKEGVSVALRVLCEEFYAYCDKNIDDPSAYHCYRMCRKTNVQRVCGAVKKKTLDVR